MNRDEIKPAHCHALARRLLAETRLIREEMGRAEDTRAVPEVSGAEPREVYFEACVAWRKAQRLAAELGVDSASRAPAAPALLKLQPGHVYQMLEAVHAVLGDVKQRLAIGERTSEETVETGRQPSDVLVAVIRVNRELSRVLERPFAPSDVFRTVALASAYVERIGGSAAMAPFERKRQPLHCYQQLEACLERATALIEKRGHKALVERGTPPDVVPGDVYDLANLVLGEIAFLHELSSGAAPMHAFEPQSTCHRLPAHVHQLARTLEAQLVALG